MSNSSTELAHAPWADLAPAIRRVKSVLQMRLEQLREESRRETAAAEFASLAFAARENGQPIPTDSTAIVDDVDDDGHVAPWFDEQCFGDLIKQLESAGGLGTQAESLKSLLHVVHSAVNNVALPFPEHWQQLRERELSALGELLPMIERWESSSVSKTLAGALSSPQSVKAQRSTQRGDAQVKLTAALTKHHRYQDGSCLNTSAIGVKELARQASVSPDSASRFFRGKFGTLSNYKAACQDATMLVHALKLLNGEVLPNQLFGRMPPSEGSDDDE